MKYTFPDMQRLILPVIAVAAIILGVWGFADYRGKFDFTDDVLSTLRLFALMFTYKSDAAIPLILSYARWLAAIATFTAIFKAWHTLPDDYKRVFSLWRNKNHAIVCGLGDRGRLIVRQLLADDKKVIVIESNPAHPLVESGRFAGAIVLTGDATSSDMLERAGVTHASELHAVLGDDNQSVMVAIEAHRLCTQPKPPMLERAWLKLSKIWGKPANKPPCKPGNEPPANTPTDKPANKHPTLNCFVHVRGMRTRELFIAHSVFSEKPTGRVYSRILDDDRLAARQATIDYAGSMIAPWRASGEEPHIVVVGGGWAGQALLVQMAHILHPCIGDARREEPQGQPVVRPLQVTVVDEKADSCEAEFNSRYPFISKEKLLAPVFVQGDIRRCDASLLDKIRGSARKIDGVFFCINNERESLSAAVQLRRLIDAQDANKTPKAPIVVCTYTGSGLCKVFQDKALQGYKNQHIHIHNMTCAACAQLGEMGDDIESIAQALHVMYRKNKQAHYKPGEPPHKNDTEWENLPENVRDSNRDQAADLFLKLACCGYSFAKGGTDDTVKTFTPFTEYTDTELSVLAEMEHRRWLIGKYLDDYAFGYEDNPNRTAWAHLKPHIKKLDEDPVEATATLLAKNGYKAWR